MRSQDHLPVRCVGAIAHDELGRLLMIQRGHDPGRGLWSLPGARVGPSRGASWAFHPPEARVGPSRGASWAFQGRESGVPVAGQPWMRLSWPAHSRSRSWNFWILPVDVLGNSGTNSTTSGTL